MANELLENSIIRYLIELVNKKSPLNKDVIDTTHKIMGEIEYYLVKIQEEDKKKIKGILENILGDIDKI